MASVCHKGLFSPITYVLLPLVFLVMMSLFLEQSNLLKTGPRASEFEPVQGKTVKFSDVQGVDEAKEELQEVVEFLKVR